MFPSRWNGHYSTLGPILELSLNSLGPPLVHVKALLEPSWTILGHLWSLLGVSWVLAFRTVFRSIVNDA